MSKQAIFRIDQGNFEQGFRVSLEIRDHQRNLVAGEVFGTLVPNSEIVTKYQKWQQAYYVWGQDENCRWWRRTIDVPSSINQNYSSSEDSVNRVKNTADEFKTAFNNWLNQSLIKDIEKRLWRNVKEDETVTFIVQTDNVELQKLPWDICDLVEGYKYFQVALSRKKEPIKGELSVPVKILVILGSDENIDLEPDWNSLKALPGANLTRIDKPQLPELREKLNSQPWDVVFFAGHSTTYPDENDARIWINDQKSLSPKEIEIELQEAVERGLKLAIFNSCDGLGLARQLDNLNIPHIIVMREPVHDKVAQKFLEHFLNSFAKGKSLHRAVCEARKKLSSPEVEKSSPNASWLPVIFQNPEEPPLFYPQPAVTIIQEPQPKSAEKKQKNWQFAWWGVGALALITLAFAIHKIIDIDQDSTRVPGISLGEEILSQNSTPEKQAGIKAFGNKNYPQAIANFKASLQKHPNDPETRIYLNNAIAANSKQTVKIAVSVPIGSNQPVAEEILRGVAQIQDEINRDYGITGLPLQVVVANDNNTPALAEKVARKLVKDPAIFAVVGHNSSNASVAAAPIYKNGKLVMISPTSFANQLREESYVFRMVPQITFFAAQLSKGLGKAIPHPKVAICVDNVSPDQESFRNEFKYVVSAYKGQHIDLQCNLADPTFNPMDVVEEIRKNDVNSLLIAPFVNNLPQASAIFKALQENRLQIELFGSPTLYNDTTIKLGGKAVEGLTISVPYFPDAKEKDSFRSLWQTELNNWRSTMAKDTTLAIATALQQLLVAKNPTRDQLDNILRSPKFKVKGATGEFKFSSTTGEREFLFQKQRSDALIRVENGQFVKLE